MASRVAFLVLASSLPALAQTVALGSTDGSQGLALPGSVSTVEDARAVALNPAALGRAPGLSLLYAHEASPARGLEADGVSLSLSAQELVGVGVATQWLRWPSPRPSQLTTVGASFGPRLLSLGAAVSWLTLPSAQGTRASWDLGLQSRPLNWLALGFTARALNEPAWEGGRASRTWTAAVGLRPLGERLTLGVDLMLPEHDPQGPRLQYTASARLGDGLSLFAGTTHGFTSTAPLILQVGVRGHVGGVGAELAAHDSGGRTGWQVVAGYASEATPGLLSTPKIAVLGLGSLGASPRGGLANLLGLDQEDRFLRTLKALEAAASDPELVALVLKVESSGLGLARADELRQALLRLRSRGKAVYAYLLSAGDAEYLVASACDAIYAAPESMFLVDGLRSSVTFLGEAAGNLGITVDVARVGAYKNFPDQFTRKDMSAEHREALSLYLDTAARALEQRVVTSRKLTPERWRAAVDEGLRSTRRARELGELDGLLTPHELDELLRARHPGATVDRRYHPWPEREERWGERRRVAIIPVLGAIAGGKNQAAPLGGEPTAGAESFISAIAEAAADPDVAAIVVRIDSGGGDGLASYLMEQAVLEARKKKPVVASLGDVAASGGYYVAAGADEIFASATTLTGSIGAFFARPALGGLGEKYGLHQVALSRGKLAGITDTWEPWTDEQRAAAQKWVNDFYDTFLDEVARGRKRSKPEIDAVARGRVWSGEDALARGLVDRLGGLIDAVAAARQRAHLPPDEDVDITIVGTHRGVLPSLMSAAASAGVVELPEPPPAPLDALMGRLGAFSWLLGPPALQARLEFDVRLQ